MENNASQPMHCLLKMYPMPVLSIRKKIICSIIVWLILVSISIPMLITIANVTQLSYLYYEPSVTPCSPNCTITLQIQEELEGPIYVMYQLNNFYQNNRKYIQSKSNMQLAGNPISDGSVCQPYITNADMNKTLSWNGTPLHPDALASPCGAIAMTFFDDRYLLHDSQGKRVIIDETSLNWPGIKGHKYKREPNSSLLQWVDPQNEHFMAWMQAAGLPNFRKLWGRITTNLPADTYTLTIINNYNSSEWQGSRYVILSTNSVFGGRNFVFPIFMLVFAAVIMVWIILLCRKAQKQ